MNAIRPIIHRTVDHWYKREIPNLDFNDYLIKTYDRIRTALSSLTLPQTQPKQVDLDEVDKVDINEVISCVDSHILDSKTNKCITCGMTYIHNPYDNLPVCDYDYYDVRAGKCQHGSVHHGNIYCKHPNCNPTPSTT